MRQRGSGSITETKDGRFRVQLWVDDRRRSLGIHPTREEADAILAAAVVDLDEGDHRDGVTLGDWAMVALDRRELQGIRGMKQERSSWKTHGASADIAALPVRAIVRADVQRWLDKVLVSRARGARKSTRAIKRTTAGNALTLMRAVLEDALARNIASHNAAADVALPRDAGTTHDAWTYLTAARHERDEQQHLLDVVPGHIRPAVRFAIFAGLRQGEQWCLELVDVHIKGPSPYVMVRYGSPGKPTKNGKPRRVDLLPEAVRAVKEQLELLATKWKNGKRRANDHGLLFPTQRGTRRQEGAPPGWERWVAACKLGRGLRWHDLRHTCASSLVAGWWGRAWTLVEVCALLGHCSIKVTERYAHLAGTITEDAVRATPPMLSESTRESTQGESLERKASKLIARIHSGSHLRDLNSRPTVYERDALAYDSAPLDIRSAHACAVRALSLVVDGDLRAGAALVDALELLMFPAQGTALESVAS